MSARRWRAVCPGAVAACGVLLLTACGTGAPTTSSRASGAVSPEHSAASGAAAAAPQSVLGAEYLAIALPANKRLDHDFDGLEDASGDDLRAATADLRDAAVTERKFDRELIRLQLPPAEKTIARLMVIANTARARLSDRAASSMTLAELRRYLPRLRAANAPVEEAVRVIRGQLDLPPPSTS